MKKYYEEPEVTVRNYILNPTGIVMTSDPNTDDNDDNPNLNDGDDYDYFGN